MDAVDKPPLTECQPPHPPLRAMIEILNGELKIYPVATSDVEAAEIMDALRFVREDFER